MNLFQYTVPYIRKLYMKKKFKYHFPYGLFEKRL